MQKAKKHLYDDKQILEAIMQNPNALNTGLTWQRSGEEWQAQQYPDGSDGGRKRNRTVLKYYHGRPCVYCNGDIDGISWQPGGVLDFLAWRWNMDVKSLDFYEAVAAAYGIQPNYDGFTDEEKSAAQKRRASKATLKDLAGFVCAALLKDSGKVARDYIAKRGLQITPRMGAWNADIKAAALQYMQDNGVEQKAAEDFLRQFIPTWRKDLQGNWHDFADDYQLIMPYSNGTANYLGFCLRQTTPGVLYYLDKDGKTVKEMPKYLYSLASSGFIKAGYCDGLKGNGEAVVIVEGALDAEAMKQNGFNNVIALGQQVPGEAVIDTLLRFNAKKLIYLPDYEYKDIKDSAGNVIGKEDAPTTGATLNTITNLLPYITGRMDGRGFVSLKIGDLATAEAVDKKAKVDADDYLKTCGAGAMRGVLERAAQWYEYELKAVARKCADDADQLAAEAIDIYARITNDAQRERLKREITAATFGYLADIKAAGINAAALRAIDQKGKQSTWAAQMGEVVEAMQGVNNEDRMAELLARAERIQSASTFASFSAQINATREDMHALIKAKPDKLQTPWALYSYDEDIKDYVESRHISFTPAAVSIFAAPTSHGKTLVLLQTAINLAKTTQKHFIYISFENNNEELYVRALSAYMGLIWKDATATDLDEDGQPLPPRKVKAPRDEVRKGIKAADLPTALFAPGRSSIDIDSYERTYWREVAPYLHLVRIPSDIDTVTPCIKNQVEEWQDNGIEVGGVFVDYMQLLQYTAVKSYSRTDELKLICAKLNDMAKDINAPVILAAQFNRTGQKNGIDDIELTDIGESAGIENYAEDIYLLWQVKRIKANKYDHDKTSGADPKAITLKPAQQRSKRCFNHVDAAGNTTEDDLRRDCLYIECLKGRDTETGSYCLLPYYAPAGTITSNESKK